MLSIRRPETPALAVSTPLPPAEVSVSVTGSPEQAYNTEGTPISDVPAVVMVKPINEPLPFPELIGCECCWNRMLVQNAIRAAQGLSCLPAVPS
jgi:hypothetical protein